MVSFISNINDMACVSGLSSNKAVMIDTSCDPIVHGGISGSPGTPHYSALPPASPKHCGGSATIEVCVAGWSIGILCVCLCVDFWCLLSSVCALKWWRGRTVLWLWLIGCWAPACGDPWDWLCIVFCKEAFCSPIDPNMSIRQIQINVLSTFTEPPHVNDTHTSALVSPEMSWYQRTVWVDRLTESFSVTQIVFHVDLGICFWVTRTMCKNGDNMIYLFTSANEVMFVCLLVYQQDYSKTS